ncbi:MAG TPA: hypothetical protein VFJ87_00630 [Rhodanobacteraceae bacterium]|jgi:hypothetical protein|nr:hypothetical protein [Rhodanobacteraceae bacterium]
MALINCYRYKRVSSNWNRDGGVYKIRSGGVAAPQPLGFSSFRLQRLLIAISTEFGNLQAQFHHHTESSALNAAIRAVVVNAGLSPANAPGTVAFGTDDLGANRYAVSLFIIDKDVNPDEALAVGIVADAGRNTDCISCGQPKARPGMDPQVKSHSVIPASFWPAIVPSALTAIGVLNTTSFSGDDLVLFNAMVNAGNEAAGSYAKPGADPQAFSMCSDCEIRQADFSLLQRHEKGTAWLLKPANHGNEAVVRTFVGSQFLPPAGIGTRDEMIRLTYNLARRVAAAIERQVFSSLEFCIRRLPAAGPVAPPVSPRGTPRTIHSATFASQSDQKAQMHARVLPQMMEQVAKRSISTWVGITSLEAHRWVASVASQSHQWVAHTSLAAGLQVSWYTFGIDHNTPLRQRLLQIGCTHARRRARTTWNGLPAEPPLVVYLAQHIDAYLQAVVELAVLFAGLKRHDSTKDEKEGNV